MENFDPET